MLSPVFRALSILVILLLLSGCSVYLTPQEMLTFDVPQAQETAPVITSMSSRTDRLTPGQSNILQIYVEFKDVNGDVGPREARIVRTVRKLSGNFQLTSSTETLNVEVDFQGIAGTFIYEARIHIPERASGAIQIEISIYDNAGFLSDPETIVFSFP